MKKCGRCAKPAVHHITEILEGEVKALHLCETCIKDYLDNPESTETESEEVETESDPNEAETVCESCGITFKEFRSRGRLGCGECYNAFRTELLQLIENIHSSDTHCGKIPKREPQTSQIQFDLARVRTELREAIEREDYEDAARLRDKLKSLEAEAFGTPS
jgi:protein arginine kinase activator